VLGHRIKIQIKVEMDIIQRHPQMVLVMKMMMIVLAIFQDVQMEDQELNIITLKQMENPLDQVILMVQMSIVR